jgi:hypothetical protein
MVGGWEEWLGLGRSDQLGGVISSVGCYVNQKAVKNPDSIPSSLIS